MYETNLWSRYSAYRYGSHHSGSHFIYADMFTSNALQLLDMAEHAYSLGNFEQCARHLEELDTLCNDNSLFLQFFVRNEIVDDLQKSTKGLPAYNTADSPNEYYYAAQALKTDFVFCAGHFLAFFERLPSISFNSSMKVLISLNWR